MKVYHATMLLTVVVTIATVHGHLKQVDGPMVTAVGAGLVLFGSLLTIVLAVRDFTKK